MIEFDGKFRARNKDKNIEQLLEAAEMLISMYGETFTLQQVLDELEKQCN